MVWFFLVVAIALIVFLAIVCQRADRDSGVLRYQRLDALFSPAERSFLGVLDQVTKHEFRVFAKVRIADELNPRKGLRKPEWQRAFNKISRKHFDFVLCNPNTLSVLCAIELNDKSHGEKARQARDAFLLDVCEAVGLPLIMLDAKQSYAPAEISAKIANAIANASRLRHPTHEHCSEPMNVPDSSISPLCPTCASPMIKRVAKGGENAGKEFWGCSNFPKCRAIQMI